MTDSIDTLSFATAPGNAVHVPVYRFGAAVDDAPTVYIQAGLYADELPPQLIANHLRTLLAERSAEGRLRGHVVLVPCANPLAMRQVMDGRLIGRHQLATFENYNRELPDVSDAVIDAVGGALGDDAAANTRAVRAAIRAELESLEPINNLMTLHLALLRLAADADYVLDLHCAEESVMHLYADTASRGEAETLARLTHCQSVLLTDTFINQTFIDVCNAPWGRLAADGHAFAGRCHAVSLEYRGRRDVNDQLALDDAERLLRWLTSIGVIRGDAPDLPDALFEATPLSGVDYLRAPTTGILCHFVEPGQWVRPGESIGVVIDPASTAEQGKAVVVPQHEGLLFARAGHRFVHRGQVVASVATREANDADEAYLPD